MVSSPSSCNVNQSFLHFLRSLTSRGWAPRFSWIWWQYWRDHVSEPSGGRCVPPRACGTLTRHQRLSQPIAIPEISRAPDHTVNKKIYIYVAATFRVYLAFWLFFFMSDRGIGLLRALGFWLPLEDAIGACGGLLGTRAPRHLQSTTVVELLWL